MIICLTGFMGCGKSSVGRRLSQLLCCPFMDLDQAIEESTGRTIPEIFATEGEEAFRRMELEALQRIMTTPLSEGTQTLVLALGGGTIMTPECAELVHSETLCIYLRATSDTLISHLENEASDRPLLTGMPLKERITVLMSQRSETYEKNAHIISDTDGKSIEAIANDIISSLDQTSSSRS